LELKEKALHIGPTKMQALQQPKTSIFFASNTSRETELGKSEFFKFVDDDRLNHEQDRLNAFVGGTMLLDSSFWTFGGALLLLGGLAVKGVATAGRAANLAVFGRRKPRTLCVRPG
jgi:hypothetical protein